MTKADLFFFLPMIIIMLFALVLTNVNLKSIRTSLQNEKTLNIIHPYSERLNGFSFYYDPIEKQLFYNNN